MSTVGPLLSAAHSKSKGKLCIPQRGPVLYTEDDPDTREMVIFTLRRNGYEVTCADTGTEALSLAKNDVFDLFLVDNWLPGLSGPELTVHTREFNKTLQSSSIPALPMRMTNKPLSMQEHKAT